MPLHFYVRNPASKFDSPTLSSKRVKFIVEESKDLEPERTSQEHVEKESKKMVLKRPGSRRNFRNEKEAIDSNQKKVREVLTQQFLNMEPKLYALALPSICVSDMEKLQTQLLAQLDDLREIDPETGNFCETKEFADLENKFVLLLKALDYFEQKKFLEALSQPKSPEECVLSEPYGEAEDAHHVSCFSFIFKKTRHA
jgi:hypothetical protein